MFLFYLEVIVKTSGPFTVIVVAENDEKAFRHARNQVEKSFLAMPEIEEMAIIDKSHIREGTGYVLRGESLSEMV